MRSNARFRGTIGNFGYGGAIKSSNVHGGTIRSTNTHVGHNNGHEGAQLSMRSV